MIISDNHKKSTIIIPLFQFLSKKFGKQPTDCERKCLPSHTCQRFPVVQNCRVPITGGRQHSFKNFFNSLNDRPPSRADCLINQIFKTISKYSCREVRIRFSCPIAMGYFRYYLLSIIYNLLLLTSYILPLTSYFFHQPSTIRNTADLVVKYSCLFPVLVVSAPLLVIFPQII